jgi:hypothetical protein
MKIAVIYGVGIAVVIALVNSFFVDIYGMDSDVVRTFLGFLPLVVLAAGLFMAMRKIKKRVYENNLTFGQAIYSGIVTCALAAVSLGVIYFFYYQFVNKNYADTVINMEVPKMEKSNYKPAQIALEIQKIKESYYPVNVLIGTTIFMLVSGIAISAIFSSILRTKDSFTEIVKRG